MVDTATMRRSGRRADGKPPSPAVEPERIGKGKYRDIGASPRRALVSGPESPILQEDQPGAYLQAATFFSGSWRHGIWMYNVLPVAAHLAHLLSTPFRPHVALAQARKQKHRMMTATVSTIEWLPAGLGLPTHGLACWHMTGE